MVYDYTLLWDFFKQMRKNGRGLYKTYSFMQQKKPSLGLAGSEGI